MDDIMDMFFIKGRASPRILSSALRQYYTSKLSSRYGWSNKVSKIVLKAYCEFIELKIISMDWYTLTILPSWPVRQVWRLMVLETDNYSRRCRQLCGHVINYHPDMEFSKEERTKLIEQTKKLYNARFEHPMKGGVWCFDFLNHWWDEYDKDLKCSQVGFYMNGVLKRWVCPCCSTKTNLEKPKLKNIHSKFKIDKLLENKTISNDDVSKDGSSKDTGTNRTNSENLSKPEETNTSTLPSTENAVIVKTPVVTSEVIINTQKKKLKRPSQSTEQYHVITRSAKKKRLN